MPTGRPDWFGTIVASGKYDTTYIPIALDVDGFITATMKGAHGTDSLLKTIAVDSSGIMKANLSVQDLDFQTVRPAYGQAKGTTGTTQADKNDTTTIVTKSGRGVVLGGWFIWEHTIEASSLRFIVRTELTIVEREFATNLNSYYRYVPGALPLYLLKYDNVNFDYIVGISHGLTFETSFDIQVENPYAFDKDVTYFVAYALVP